MEAATRKEESGCELIPCEEAKEIAHVGFEIGLVLKGVHGLIQVVGGMLMLFITPARLCALTDFLTRHELSEDPRDLVANFLIRLSGSFSVGAQHFAELYLFSHGLIRCVLIFLLWRKKLWAYPLTVLCFSLFIAYQLYRYTLSGSPVLLAFSAFDTVLTVLTYLEYKALRAAKG